jgi:chorismate mutase
MRTDLNLNNRSAPIFLVDREISGRSATMDFMKPDTVLNLNNIRASLVRMEETIVFNLIERAQFYSTCSVYKPDGIKIPGFEGSFLDWFLGESEKTHCK